MDPAILAQQATEILVPALSSLYLAGKPVVEKGKEVLGDMLYEKALEKVGSKSGKKAKVLLEKISPKMTESLGKALTKASRNSKDPKAKEELQQEILKLLMKNPDLAREIEFTINLNIENFENYGQLAVGNYNNFFNFESPSGDEFIKIIECLNQQRKEASNQEILSRYNPSALPYYPDKLKQFVTHNRADKIKKSLIYLENHRILLLSGVGGVGKSTLSRALVDLRPVNVPEPFYFNFNQNQDAKLGDILEKLAAYIKAPEIAAFKAERREPGKPDVDRLTDELQRRSQVWLIFDDLSTMLEDRQFKDKGIELLFSSLRYNTHNAKVIVTSRILPILENGESLIDVVEDEEKQNLNGLERDFAVDYLVRNGLAEVEPEKLEELEKGVDGHPLALKLLVELVKEFGVEDTLEDLSMYQESKEDTIKKARRLFDKLAGEEKEFLERISVYREPVGLKALKVMFMENTPTNAVRKLIDKSLLETNHNSSYWLHPLVHEFAYHDIENKKGVHLIAFNYYNSLTLPENPKKKEDLQPAIEAQHHACMAGAYDVAAEKIFSSKLYLALEIWGNYNTLIEIYEKLLPENHFKDEPLLQKEKDQVAILGNLGNVYNIIGEAKKAIQYYEATLKINRITGNKRYEIVDLGNIGLAYFQLGMMKEAIEYHEQTLNISRDLEYKHYEGASLGNLGLAYLQIGEMRTAIQYFEKALPILREVDDKRREGSHLCNIGLAYLQLGEVRKAIQYVEQALNIAKEINDQSNIGNCLGNLGLIHFRLGNMKNALEYYKQALSIAKEINDRRNVGNWLGNIGLVHFHLGEVNKASEYYEQALDIAKEIHDRSREGTWTGDLGIVYNHFGKTKKAIEYNSNALKIAVHTGEKRREICELGNLGNVCIKLGPLKKANEYYEQALKISREIGDRREEGNSIRNLGTVYSQLGDPKKAIEYYGQALKISKDIGDRRGEGADLGNLGLAYSNLGEPRKAIEFLKQSLAIGKAIEDPRIIGFCEQKLKELEGSES